MKKMKKLVLSRETIATLDPEALAGAVGMSTVPGCITSGCPTQGITCRSNPQICVTAYPCPNTQTNCIGTQGC
jgi:hypothetical protein